MACAKPPDPASTTKPTDLRQPTVQPAREAIRRAEHQLDWATNQSEIDSVVAKAQRQVRRAQEARVPKSVLERMRKDLHRLEQEAATKKSGLPKGNTPIEIGPGMHPPGGKRPYTYVRNGNRITAFPATVSSPMVEDPATRDRMLQVPLKAAIRNKSIDSKTVDTLKGALLKVLDRTAGATGIAPGPNYSGQGSTGLMRNLAHKTRGPAYASEIITASELMDRTAMASLGGKDLRIGPGDRIDFGVKFGTQMADGSPTTVEADILKTDTRGGRAGIDVKHSSTGKPYSGGISERQLEGVRQVLDRGELKSFHFVTNTVFSDKDKGRIADYRAAGYAIEVHERFEWSDS